ncbi:hypothetical protein SO802_027986 [Lithocarpus litseifolius]|uniref:Replication protein A subunit n=1 Tax=Lithocarpus litseifolius TaxID=425828 RepID=A0AAW2BPN7_9ROSI
MAMCWTPLSKLSTDRDNWTIKVRVLRMWDAINTKNNEFISLDMIFIDEEGSTIHVIFRKNQARTFRPQLLEGRVYTIKNFRVESTKGEFRPVHNDIKIWFMTITTIMESNKDMNSIQKYCFEFADYDQIQNQCYNYTYLIDVVGKLVAVGNVEEPQVNGAPRKLRNLQLLLKEGKEIRLSLWGTSVWQIDEDVYKNNPGPFVLIATSTIVKSFGGKFSLSSTSATKIYLNLEIPEVAEIIDRNGKKHDPIQEIPKIHAKQFSEEDFSSNNMKTIPELKCIEWDPAKQYVNCYCVATISNIDTTMGWYYISCVLCGKKVKPQSGSFWCAKCETKTNLPIPRYRIQIEVFDSTDKTTFVIFDRDAEKILNKSAKDLAEKQTEIDIEEGIPRDLKKILGRQYIFLLRLNEFNLKDGFENYTVAKIFDAPSNEKKIPMQNLSDNKSASTNFITVDAALKFRYQSGNSSNLLPHKRFYNSIQTSGDGVLL